MEYNIFNRKNSNTPSIKIAKTWDADATGKSDFFAPGALISVENGKGLLREAYGEFDKKSYLTLMFGDTPLFEMQGDEYFCPTCEKIIRSGYGELDEEFSFQWTKVNQNASDVSLEEAIKECFPLLGLLNTGYYVVVDTTLHPTDGNGHFFWDVPGSFEEPNYFRGTCLFQFDDFEWGNLRPHFMVATQAQSTCNMERVQYYCKNPGGRAIAYFMDGYMTALLDGHHKSYAAALEGKDVNALVICPAHLYWPGTARDNYYERGMRAFDISFTFKELGMDDITAKSIWETYKVSEQLTPEKQQDVNNIIFQSHQRQRILENGNELAIPYPNAEEQASIDRVGGITDELLDDIISKKIFYTPREVKQLMIVLGALHHRRLFEMGDFFLREGGYCGTERYIITVIVQAMMKDERTEALEQYLIDVMVKFEDECPEIKDLILGYF